MYNLVSFAGIFIIMLLAWSLSTDRKTVNWRLIGWGAGLQALFAVFIFILPIGPKIFLVINGLVVRFLDAATAGTKFLFGPLALPPGTTDASGQSSIGFILAFQALPTIIFFASLVGGLYYIGVMPWLIGIFSRIFTRLMRVSGAESLCASSNIFVGVESAMTIRPYLSNMTRSELCTILTTGMATIASSVLALYVFILQNDFPNIAGHLVSASVLSAPAGLVMSKLLLPETEKPETLGVDVKPLYEKDSSLIEALINGANSGVRLVVGVSALLLAFLGIVALIDMGLGAFGGYVNGATGLGIDWSLAGLLGYLFYPLTIVLGVPVEDAYHISKLIGERLVATEVKSYMDLTGLLSAGTLQHPRSAFIATYALCGFAHVASLAIFVGGVSALAPERTAELSRVGPRALLAATLACLMTAAVAGTFMTGSSILLGP